MRLLRDGDESAVATMVAAGPGGPGEAAATRVVIAEDHAEMADVLRTYLEAVGYEVRVARDGVEAAAITAAFAPAVVVLDANMPGWSGWALLASWKGVPHEAPGGTRGEAAPGGGGAAGGGAGGVRAGVRPARFGEPPRSGTAWGHGAGTAWGHETGTA